MAGFSSGSSFNGASANLTEASSYIELDIELDDKTLAILGSILCENELEARNFVSDASSAEAYSDLTPAAMDTGLMGFSDGDSLSVRPLLSITNPTTAHQTIPMEATKSSDDEKWEEEELFNSDSVKDKLRQALDKLKLMLQQRDYQIRQGIASKGQLRGYQAQAIQTFFERAPTQRQHVLSLPTGLGKTLTFVSIAQCFQKVLVVTPQTLIGEQVHAGFCKYVNGTDPLPVSTAAKLTLAKLKEALSRSGVFIATYQLLDRIARDDEEDQNKAKIILAQLATNGIDLVVFDEAHHITHRRPLIETIQSGGYRGPVIFATATPSQSSGADKKSLYQALGGKPENLRLESEDINLVQAIQERYLAPLCMVDVGFEIVDAAGRKKLEACETEQEFQKTLQASLLKPKVMYGYLKLLTQPLANDTLSAHGRKILVVCNSTAQAEALAKFLNEQMMPLVNKDPILKMAQRKWHQQRDPSGLPYSYAVAVHSKMQGGSPQQAIQAFERGCNSVIVAVDMISEGVDIPKLDCIIGPPTQSEIRLIQVLGRGLRLDPNSPEKSLLFINIVVANKSTLHGRIITNGAMVVGNPVYLPVPQSPPLNLETVKKLKESAFKYSSTNPSTLFDMGAMGSTAKRLKEHLSRDRSEAQELASEDAQDISGDIANLLEHLMAGVSKVAKELNSSRFTYIKKASKRKSRPDEAGPDTSDAPPPRDIDVSESVCALKTALSEQQSAALGKLNGHFSEAKKKLNATLKGLKGLAARQDDDEPMGESTAEPAELGTESSDEAQASKKSSSFAASSSKDELKTPAQIRTLLIHMLEDIHQLRNRAVSGSAFAAKGWTLTQHSNPLTSEQLTKLSLVDLVAEIEHMTETLHSDGAAQSIVETHVAAAKQARMEKEQQLEEKRLVLEQRKIAEEAARKARQLEQERLAIEQRRAKEEAARKAEQLKQERLAIQQHKAAKKESLTLQEPQLEHSQQLLSAAGPPICDATKQLALALQQNTSFFLDTLKSSGCITEIEFILLKLSSETLSLEEILASNFHRTGTSLLNYLFSTEEGLIFFTQRLKDSTLSDRHLSIKELAKPVFSFVTHLMTLAEGSSKVLQDFFETLCRQKNCHRFLSDLILEFISDPHSITQFFNSNFFICLMIFTLKNTQEFYQKIQNLDLKNIFKRVIIAVGEPNLSNSAIKLIFLLFSKIPENLIHHMTKEHLFNTRPSLFHQLNLTAEGTEILLMLFRAPAFLSLLSIEDVLGQSDSMGLLELVRGLTPELIQQRREKDKKQGSWLALLLSSKPKLKECFTDPTYLISQGMDPRHTGLFIEYVCSICEPASLAEAECHAILQQMRWDQLIPLDISFPRGGLKETLSKVIPQGFAGAGLSILCYLILERKGLGIQFLAQQIQAGILVEADIHFNTLRAAAALTIALHPFNPENRSVLALVIYVGSANRLTHKLNYNYSFLEMLVKVGFYDLLSHIINESLRNMEFAKFFTSDLFCINLLRHLLTIDKFFPKDLNLNQRDHKNPYSLLMLLCGQHIKQLNQQEMDLRTSVVELLLTKKPDLLLQLTNSLLFSASGYMAPLFVFLASRSTRGPAFLKNLLEKKPALLGYQEISSGSILTFNDSDLSKKTLCINKLLESSKGIELLELICTKNQYFCNYIRSNLKRYRQGWYEDLEKSSSAFIKKLSDFFESKFPLAVMASEELPMAPKKSVATLFFNAPTSSTDARDSQQSKKPRPAPKEEEETLDNNQTFSA